jgi:RNA polymerase sigma factor (sigma-70 family)
MDPMLAPIEPLDTTVARRAASGDAIVVAAWAEHHEELYAFLVRTTRDPETAEDLLSEAFLRLTKEVRAERTPDNVRAWLYRVAANLAMSRGRRLAASLRWLTRTAAAGRPVDDDPPEAGYLAREGRSELVAALEGLGADARAALLLSAEGFSGPEIAVAIGRSEAATRTLLCRTRLAVRRRLASPEAVR